jgi:hypothetical protein
MPEVEGRCGEGEHVKDTNIENALSPETMPLPAAFDARALEEMWMRDAARELEKKARQADRRSSETPYGAACNRQAARWRAAAAIFRTRLEK